MILDCYEYIIILLYLYTDRGADAGIVYIFACVDVFDGLSDDLTHIQVDTIGTDESSEGHHRSIDTYLLDIHVHR